MDDSVRSIDTGNTDSFVRARAESHLEPLQRLDADKSSLAAGRRGTVDA
jgi:hypothetical protein